MNITAKILFAFVICIFLLLNICAYPAKPVSAKFSPQQMSEDFKILREALETGHSGIYRYQSKAAMDKLFKQTADSLNAPLDEYEFYQKLAPLVATVKCGHTSIRLPEQIRQKLMTQIPLLPFQVKIIDDRVFIFRDLTMKTDASGKEIIKINGTPITEIIKIMMEATPSDAGIKTGKEWRLSNGWRFNIYLEALLGIKSSYNLELKSTVDGTVTNLQADGINLPELQKYWLAKYPQDQEKEQANEPTSYLKFLQNDRIALLKIGSFSTLVDSKRQLRLEDFIRESFSSIKAKKSDALIIDLQNNGGGEDDLGKLLLSFLLDKPFKYYDDLVINNVTFPFLKYAGGSETIPYSFVEKWADNRYHAIKHPNWGIQQSQSESFGGRVYVLINGGSFSTTAEFLSQLHFHKRAVFIGEESGGGYYGNSSGFMPTLTLPNTKMDLRVPLMTYYMAVKSAYPADHGVIPDYPVKNTIDDYLQAKDTSLNYAVKLANDNLIRIKN